MSPHDAVIDVSTWVTEEDEPLGSREKVWIRDGHPDDDTWWLFKEPRSQGLLEPGADLWAEVLACVVADRLQVPAALVRFATQGERRGVISRRVGDDLVHGNELLSRGDETYERNRKGAVQGHDLHAIAEVLSPYAGSVPGMSGFESFIGYLVLDAVIGNTDRHHENWAVLERAQSLAPSYDHGASLGFNVPPARRSDAVAVAYRGVARHFPGKPALVELARTALSRVDPGIREIWQDRVRALRLTELEEDVAAIPADWMSEGARTFVIHFVAENQRRMLS